MQTRPRTIALLLCASFMLPAAVAQATKIPASNNILETIEWTWAAKPDAPDPALPNVLLLGDSITRGYYPEVTKLLAGRANCYLFATSAASGDPRLIHQVADYFAMMPLKFTVIHFNNGMHGWKYTEAAYGSSLPQLVETLRAKSHGAKLVWATTTPVHTADSGGATNPRIDQRNAESLRTMQRFHIAIDDQHALMAAHDDLHNGDVHYTEAGSAVQAKQVQQIVEKLLPAN
ncbi:MULTISPECIES: SGNH/GDSL hydrolase family protein [Acidobacteriaceae]|uniref:SGNH/GDSL hydrolase family protein n=1 Tax=Acidobacteriaceae TaxID=204434 RepID=UPI00131B0FFB|nr:MULTISPECIES: SGNH/GDSL hydrolase family protein [Acidobacteriaceae]MDW5264285.1 SGNH/GDSL hydrolase family protein [Edaphobacter sp.]